MKKLKIIMAMLMVTGMVATGFAQETEKKKKQIDPEARATKEVEMISKAIPDLSEKQKKEIREASLEQHKNMVQLYEGHKEYRDEIREKVKEMRTERRNSYKEILSQEQYIQFLEKSQEFKAKRVRKEMHHRKGKGNKGKRHQRNNKGGGQ